MAADEPGAGAGATTGSSGTATGSLAATTGNSGPRQAWVALPWLVRTAVLWSACLVVVVAGLYLLGKIAVLLAPLAIALAATIFLTALLDPVLLLLRRLRLPRRLRRCSPYCCCSASWSVSARWCGT
ncbi:hypothetical protein GCM10027614_42990 [Micromonospora vulcania]